MSNQLQTIICQPRRSQITVVHLTSSSYLLSHTHSERPPPRTVLWILIGQSGEKRNCDWLFWVPVLIWTAKSLDGNVSIRRIAIGCPEISSSSILHNILRVRYLSSMSKQCSSLPARGRTSPCNASCSEKQPLHVSILIPVSNSFTHIWMGLVCVTRTTGHTCVPACLLAELEKLWIGGVILEISRKW